MFIASSCQICQTMAFFVFHFSAMCLVSLIKALTSDWLFCFTVPFSLAEKNMPFRAKESAIRE